MYFFGHVLFHQIFLGNVWLGHVWFVQFWFVLFGFVSYNEQVKNAAKSCDKKNNKRERVKMKKAPKDIFNLSLLD